uniref:Putative secreted protein n=1 Tax=Anopheles darlingi TaxID=43151 RepID=A0A2M4DQJ5_ANODA
MVLLLVTTTGAGATATTARSCVACGGSAGRWHWWWWCWCRSDGCRQEIIITARRTDRYETVRTACPRIGTPACDDRFLRLRYG